MLQDLRLMGASNALSIRSGAFSGKLLSNLEKYFEKTYRTDGSDNFPLTFCIIYFMAWTWTPAKVMNSALQIIDQNKIFKLEHTLKLEVIFTFLYFAAFCRLDALKTFVEEFQGASNVQSPVVAVFGSQSSGKSTLLNSLFGTKFDVMSSDKRSQTTHGTFKHKSGLCFTLLCLRYLAGFRVQGKNCCLGCRGHWWPWTWRRQSKW